MAEQTLVQLTVLSYWIRTNLSPHQIFVDQLTEIALAYYPNCLLYGWDGDRCHDSLMISDGNKRITSMSFELKSVFSKYIIGRRNRIIRWEVTLVAYGNYSEGLMKMGIMDAKYIDDANIGAEVGDQNHQIALRVAAGSYPERIINTEWSNFGRNHMKWGIGDRAKLEFKNGKCSAYLNDQSLGILTDDLPETFFLAISPCDKGTVLETSFFEIVFEGARI